jgi:hypothetical protein
MPDLTYLWDDNEVREREGGKEGGREARGEGEELLPPSRSQPHSSHVSDAAHAVVRVRVCMCVSLCVCVYVCVCVCV